MLIEIEQAILDRLDAKLIQPFRKLKLGDGRGKGQKPITLPSIQVGCAGGTGKKQSFTATRIEPRIFVFVEFENLRDDASRRRGGYPIVLAVIKTLIGQKLGLEIDALSFVRFDHTTSDEDAGAGLINFTLEFRTGFEFRNEDNESEAAALVNLALDYYLKPGDEVKDLSSEMDMTGEA